MQDELLFKKAAARILGVSRATLWRMIKSDVIPAVDIFNGIQRIRASDVQRIIASQTDAKYGGSDNGKMHCQSR
jgi:predicted site-specific integrase-resolvase